ncbi:MAG: hypothetical protein HPY69_16900 [Armatimonadetes bacterium]|nr:hypothetical protein [Armatimonadota bacterium]
MPLTERENYVRNVRMTGPEWMPCTVAISGASWNQWRNEMEDVAARHPLFFPGFQKGQRDWDAWDPGPAHRAGERYTDAWGCVWYTDIDGLEGVVIEHPLADWDALATYRPPDASVQLDRSTVDWEQVRQRTLAAKAAGQLTAGSLAHGFLLMRMYYLRGFDNLMLDFATEDPRLDDLIALINEHNRIIVDQYVSMGVDMIDFPEDLGTQTASLISPKHFHRYIMPAYQSLMQPVRDAGIICGSHSDGCIMELIDDLLEAGLDIVNPQDLCNGIDNLAREVKGRVCIKLDVDRQTVVPFGSPDDIHDLIEEEVRKLGSPQGGLELVCGIYPPTPPENVDAVCSAMEEFRTYWFDGRGN